MINMNTVLHSTISRARADNWFSVSQVNMRPLSSTETVVVRYQLDTVVLHAGRSAAPPWTATGDLSTVSTVRTNLQSVAWCCTAGRRDRSDASSHAPSATATQATPDALPRRSVTADWPADVVLSGTPATRLHEPSRCNVATYTSLTATVPQPLPFDRTWLRIKRAYCFYFIQESILY